MRRSALALAATLALAACGAPPRAESDWEKRNLQGKPDDEDAASPAYPQSVNLVQFRVPDTEGFRYFVDRTTLTVDAKEGLVRYVLLARSSEGAQNVTFEGMRCQSAENRVYAVGQSDGTWMTARSAWRTIGAPRHLTLYRDFFCPQSELVGTTADAVRALTRGGR